jgi:hypothetical protein
MNANPACPAPHRGQHEHLGVSARRAGNGTTRFTRGPLAEVYEQWLGSFAPLWDQTLSRLKVTAERPPLKAAPGSRPDQR